MSASATCKLFLFQSVQINKKLKFWWNKDGNKTSVKRVKLEKTLLEASKIMRMSSPMLDRANWGHRQKFLGSSYLCEESSHIQSYTPSTFPSCKKV